MVKTKTEVVITCDICGKQINSNTDITIYGCKIQCKETKFLGLYTETKEIDLCDECRNNLKELLKQKVLKND